MPHIRIRRRLNQEPSLECVLEMAKEFAVSKEAAAVHYAAHYAALHQDTMGIIFSKGGLVRYAVKSKNCPWLTHGKKGMALPEGMSRQAVRLSALEDYDTRDWTPEARSEVGRVVQVQTLTQDGGYAMTLLWFSGATDDEDDLGVDDAYDRLGRG